MKSYRGIQAHILRDPLEAAEYLDVVLEQGDPALFLVALRNVAEAHGGLRAVSRVTRLNRPNLHKMLSKSGRPEIQTIARLLKAFGLRLSVAGLHKHKEPRNPSLKKAA